MDNYLGDDDNSKKELYQLIALSKILNPIEDINGDSNLQFKEEMPETEIRSESRTEGNIIVTYIKKYERKKRTDYNNNITYTDWKLITIETKFKAIPVKTEVMYINDRGTEKKASHDGFQCMGYQMFTIIGNRFKCTVCKNFDYCEDCEKKLKDKHWHTFV